MLLCVRERHGTRWVLMSAVPFGQVLPTVFLLCVAALSALELAEVLGAMGLALLRLFRERVARLLVLWRDIRTEVNRWRELGQ